MVEREPGRRESRSHNLLGRIRCRRVRQIDIRWQHRERSHYEPRGNYPKRDRVDQLHSPPDSCHTNPNTIPKHSRAYQTNPTRWAVFVLPDEFDRRCWRHTRRNEFSWYIQGRPRS